MKTSAKHGPGLPGLGWLSVGWYFIFLLAPLLLVAATSFATRGLYGGIDWSPTFGNFARSFDFIYLSILFKSVVLSFSTTFLCLLLGFPIALTMATAQRRDRSVAVLLLAIPFLTNLVIRICAIKSFTAYDGPLAQTLTAFGIGFDPYALSQNSTLVAIGMVSTYLPFMVFPLFAALEKFDFTLVEAAEDLGASFPQILKRVLLPSLRGPVVSGCLLVFVPAMGEFLIPDLLGGAKSMLAGNLISEQFLKARDWPFGSALSLLLMVFLGCGVALASIARGREDRAR